MWHLKFHRGIFLPVFLSRKIGSEAFCFKSGVISLGNLYWIEFRLNDSFGCNPTWLWGTSWLQDFLILIFLNIKLKNKIKISGNNLLLLWRNVPCHHSTCNSVNNIRIVDIITTNSNLINVMSVSHLYHDWELHFRLRVLNLKRNILIPKRRK